MTRLNSARLQQGFRDKFAGDLARTFREDLGRLEEVAGAAAIRQFFLHSMARSQRNGFELQGEIIKFSFIAVHLGLYFDEDPLLAEMREGALWGHPGAHPNVGLNRMFDNADLMIAEGLIGADQGYVPGFLDACRAAKDAGSLADVHEICVAANPRRAEALGEEVVVAGLTASLRDLEHNHPRFRGHDWDWAIAAYFLGHGFARNPLFAWVPWDISEGGLTLVRRKLDA